MQRNAGLERETGFEPVDVYKRQMLALLQAFNPQKQATEFRIENQTVYSLGSPSEKPSEKNRKSVPAIVLLTGVANRANTVEDVRTAVIRLMKAAEATEPVWVRK